MEKEADFTAYTDWGVPGKEMVRTARLVASARLADAQGDLASAANAYEEAVAVEDAPASREPPYWYDPIRQLLGSVYPRQGTLDAAEKALHDSLARQACTQAWRGGAAPDIVRLSAAGPAGCKRDA